MLKRFNKSENEQQQQVLVMSETSANLSRSHRYKEKFLEIILLNLQMINFSQKQLKLVECPRDAMQGWYHFIPTVNKVAYINELLKVGFDTLDAGSFVSAKAIPQMQDSEIVFEKIDWKNSKTKLLAIVANARGAETATKFEQIRYIGYPFSISETFQIRNTNATIEESLDRTKQIIQLFIDFQSPKQ